MEIVKALNEVFWGWLVAGILLGTGLFFTIALGFPQIRDFKKIFSSSAAGVKREKGVISGFGALCAALGSQLGTGSLVGVATALASGGPGAIFWMWMTALLGMPISFSEAVLAQLYRVKNEDGTYRGGPAYYMERGLGSKLLAGAFSVSLIAGIGFAYVMAQSNSITNAFIGVVHIPAWVPGLVLAVIVGAVVFGGLTRVVHFFEVIIPFKAIIYLLLSLWIVIWHLDMFIDVMKLIFTSAFNFESAVGGVAGHTIKEAFRYGVARGLFSNDAGNGTAPTMHASAVVKHPVQQGFTAMFGTFLVTCVICSCTAFVILFTGALDSGTTGILLTEEAFGRGVPYGNLVPFIAMPLFGFTALVADIYYAEVNLRWLLPKLKSVPTIYRVLGCLFIIVGSTIPVVALWEIVDLFSAIMVFINVIALLMLVPKVRRAIADYRAQKQAGIDVPVWDYDAWNREVEERLVIMKAEQPA